MKGALLLLVLLPQMLMAGGCLSSSGYTTISTCDLAGTEITITAKDTPVAWACTAIDCQDDSCNYEATTTGTIHIHKVGDALIHHRICFTDGVNATYEWGVYKNGTIIECTKDCDNAPALGYGKVTATVVVPLVIGDTLDVRVANKTNTNNPKIIHGCLTVLWETR